MQVSSANPRAAVGLVLGCLFALSAARGEEKAPAPARYLRLHEAARPRPPIPGAPKAADVCMRSLRPRPVSKNDPHDTLDAMRGFHVTWLEWTYGNDAAFIRKVHELGATYGAAAAAGSYLGDAPVEQWNVVDLDGYEDAFALGKGIADDRYTPEAAPLVLEGGADRLFAFARAKPGQADAPVVVHLLDWRDEPQPFTVAVRPAAFFGPVPLRFRLFTPVLPHDKAAHDRAFDTKDYSPLVREVELARGIVNTVELPALKPWGMLVVEPDPATPVDAPARIGPAGTRR